MNPKHVFRCFVLKQIMIYDTFSGCGFDVVPCFHGHHAICKQGLPKLHCLSKWLTDKVLITLSHSLLAESENRTESILFLCSCGLTENLNFLLIVWCEGVYISNVAYSHACTASCRLLWRPVWECHECLWLQSVCQQWNLQCDWPLLLHLRLSKRWGVGPSGQALHFIEDDRLNRTLLTDPSHFRVSGRDCCLVVFSHPHPHFVVEGLGVGWGTKVALPSPPLPPHPFQNFHIEEMRVFCWLAYFHWFIGSRDHFLGLCKSAEKIWGYICNKLEVFRVKFSKHGLVFDFVLEWFSFRSPTSILLVYTRNDSRQYDCG